uniref:Ig-like domain-containing protein n=1 Tax=Monodelphis domestica TaxID=13616 RepID=F7G306_MONDO
MTPALSVLLCLGGSPGPNSSPSLPDGLPRPSLRAENGSVVPQGGAVTLRCRGSWEAVEWRLEKRGGSGWSLIKAVRQAGNEGEFSLPSVTSHDAGTYRCLYRHSSYRWSDRSDPLELVVTGKASLPRPSWGALPSSEVASGQNVTLQCWSEPYHDGFLLCKEEEEISCSWTWRHGWGPQADFFFPAVTPTQDGTYRCFGFNSSSPSPVVLPHAPLVLQVSGEVAPAPPSPSPSSPRLPLPWGSSLPAQACPGDPRGERGGGGMQEEAQRQAGNEGEFSLPSVTSHDAGTYRCLYRHPSSWWSERSDPLELPRPSLTAENGSLVPLGENVTLRCRGSWEADLYHLEKEKGSKKSKIMDVRAAGIELEFPISYVTAKDAGTYHCWYRHSFIWSEPSDPLELMVTGEDSSSSPRNLPLAPPAISLGSNLRDREEAGDSAWILDDPTELVAPWGGVQGLVGISHSHPCYSQCQKRKWSIDLLLP